MKLMDEDDQRFGDDLRAITNDANFSDAFLVAGPLLLLLWPASRAVRWLRRTLKRTEQP